MDVYAAEPDESVVHRDSRNLFALRKDVHSCQFEFGNFVIVPIDGRMVTHFINKSHESAAHYHNNHFDTNLSHEFLFARFAWAIIKKAHTTYMCLPAARKTFSRKTAPGKRAVGPDDGNADDGDADDGDGDEPMDPQPKSGVTGQATKGIKRKRPDSPGVPGVHDAHELDKDIAKAKLVAPFFRMSLKPSYHRNI
jgi:hypothetical protein